MKISDEGGAIVDPRAKEKKRHPKQDEALAEAAQIGGALKDPKRRTKKKRSKQDEALAAAAQVGGAIRKARKKKGKKRVKESAEALAEQAQVGGAIRGVTKAPKKKINKKRKKQEDALREQAQVGGVLKSFADDRHKRLIGRLSGRGARHDSPQTRRLMSHILQDKHPDLHKAYFSGKVPDPLYHHQFHQYSSNPNKVDKESDVTDFGGSLLPVSHFEHGVPVIHNADYQPHFEIV